MDGETATTLQVMDKKISHSVATILQKMGEDLKRNDLEYAVCRSPENGWSVRKTTWNGDVVTATETIQISKTKEMEEFDQFLKKAAIAEFWKTSTWMFHVEGD